LSTNVALLRRQWSKRKGRQFQLQTLGFVLLRRSLSTLFRWFGSQRPACGQNGGLSCFNSGFDYVAPLPVNRTALVVRSPFFGLYFTSKAGIISLARFLGSCIESHRKCGRALHTCPSSTPNAALVATYPTALFTSLLSPIFLACLTRRLGVPPSPNRRAVATYFTTDAALLALAPTDNQPTAGDTGPDIHVCLRHWLPRDRASQRTLAQHSTRGSWARTSGSAVRGSGE
jgi:hypothetical protein